MKRNGFAPLLIILIIAILGVVGYFAYKNYLIKQSATQNLEENSITNIVNNTPESTPKSYISKTFVLENGVYKDTVNGFSFRVPDGFPISQNDYNYDPNFTFVYVYKTSSLPGKGETSPGQVSKEDSLSVIKALSGAQPDLASMKKLNDGWGWALNESEKIVNKNNHNIFYGTTFSAFTECSTNFHHAIVFALEDGFVDITILGDHDYTETVLPKYISHLTEGNCFISQSGFDGMTQLYRDLASGKPGIDKDVVNWYNTLNEVLNSLTFTK